MKQRMIWGNLSKLNADKTRKLRKSSIRWRKILKPCHEIMVLFVLRKLILETCIRSHPVRLGVWFLVGPFVYFRASTNFQFFEVLNLLPLKFGSTTENFRKFHFATWFYRYSSICILLWLCFFLDIFNRLFNSLLWLWLSWVSLWLWLSWASSSFCFN